MHQDTPRYIEIDQDSNRPKYTEITKIEQDRPKKLFGIVKDTLK